ncbi:hypothetical protein JNW87_09190 [Micromonospora sp. ATA51]|nr:hypothetical protein [Micromonospora sp. ATA51]
MAERLMEAGLRVRFGQMADSVFVTSAGIQGPPAGRCSRWRRPSSNAGEFPPRASCPNCWTSRRRSAPTSCSPRPAGNGTRSSRRCRPPCGTPSPGANSPGWWTDYAPVSCLAATPSNAWPTCPGWRSAAVATCNPARPTSTTWPTRWAARNRTTESRLLRSKRPSRRSSTYCSRPQAKWPTACGHRRRRWTAQVR